MQWNSWSLPDIDSIRRVSLFTKTMNFALVSVTSACYSPLHFGIRRVFITMFTSTFSFILKMLAIIVATEIHLFLNKCSFTNTKPSWLVGRDNVTQRHLAIVSKTYTDFPLATVSSQTINNGGSNEVRQTICTKNVFINY